VKNKKETDGQKKTREEQGLDKLRRGNYIIKKQSQAKSETNNTQITRQIRTENMIRERDQ
jgi:hypothetical protein